MSKNFITVDNFLKWVDWRSGILISLFPADQPIQAFSEIEYSLKPRVECVATMDGLQPDLRPSAVGDVSDVEFFWGRTFNVSYMLDDAFSDLVERIPQASEVEETFFMIRDGLSDIIAEKVSVSYDVSNQVLNVAYRLPDSMLLSVSKPFNTMSDSYVMFNLYHQRELLISDTAELSLLSHYIHSAEQKALK